MELDLESVACNRSVAFHRCRMLHFISFTFGLSKSDCPRPQRSEDHADGGAYPRIGRDRTGSGGASNEVVHSVTEKTADNYTDDQANNHDAILAACSFCSWVSTLPVRITSPLWVSTSTAFSVPNLTSFANSYSTFAKEILDSERHGSVHAGFGDRAGCSRRRRGVVRSLPWPIPGTNLQNPRRSVYPRRW